MEALTEPFKITFAALIVGAGVFGGGLLVVSAVKIGKFGIQTLINGAKGVAQGVGKKYGETSWGQFRKGKKEEVRQQTSAGNYSGYNPIRRVRSRANKAINNSAVANKLTGGYVGERSFNDAMQRRKNREDVAKMFNNDTTLAGAWVETGGTASRSTLAARGLTDPQIQVYQQMQRTKRHRQAESFMAAQQLLADSGEGTEATMQATLDRVKQLNPGSYLTDAAGLAEYSRSSYRNKGRGDLVNRDGSVAGHPDIQGFSAGPTDQGWSEIQMSHLSRHAINATNPGGRASFQRWMAQAQENQRTVLASLDAMEGRAKTEAMRAYADQFSPTGDLAVIDADRVRFGLRT